MHLTPAKLGLCAVAFVAAAAGLTHIVGDYEYSSGKRSGGVDKISEKGLGCKTWEGQLAMQNFVTGPDGQLTNTFAFSVKDPEIVKKLQDANVNGTQVSVTYSQTLMHWPCEQDTDYEIVDVQPLKDQSKKAPINALN